MESILRNSSSGKINSRTVSPVRRSESSLAKIFPNMSAMLSREDRNQRASSLENRLWRPSDWVVNAVV
jgi:hypothetical protein